MSSVDSKRYAAAKFEYEAKEAAKRQKKATASALHSKIQQKIWKIYGGFQSRPIPE